MRLSQAAIVGVLLGLVVVLTACGGKSASDSGQATAAPSEAQLPSRSRSRSRSRSSADADCRGQFHPFLGSMDALREDLAVGLSYEGYLDELREVQAAYDRIHVRRLPIGCLLVVAAAGEKALNRYIDAANVWGDCLATAACETEAIEPRLQRRWARASDFLTSAQSGL